MYFKFGSSCYKKNPRGNLWFKWTCFTIHSVLNSTNGTSTATKSNFMDFLFCILVLFIIKFLLHRYDYHDDILSALCNTYNSLRFLCTVSSAI